MDEAPLLEDILLGGVYGSATESRLHSSTMTLSAAAGQPSAGLSRSLFPSAKQLQDRFPYLEEKPWLLPWAWGTRLIYYLHTKPDSRGTVATGNQRIALLRTYGIIERT